MNISQFLLAIIMLLKLLSINSGRTEGRVEPFQNDPNIWGKQVAQRYLQNNICYLWSPISPWSRPCSKSLFRAFFLGMVYIVIIQKISFEWDRLQAFLNIDHDYENICFLKKLRNKFGTKFGSWSSQKMQKILFDGFNEWEISVYFGPLFVLVKTLLDALKIGPVGTEKAPEWANMTYNYVSYPWVVF